MMSDNAGELEETTVHIHCGDKGPLTREGRPEVEWPFRCPAVGSRGLLVLCMIVILVEVGMLAVLVYTLIQGMLSMKV